MPRASSTPAWYTSTLKPGGSLILLMGSLSAAVGIGNAGTGAIFAVASPFGRPTAQNGSSSFFSCAKTCEIASAAASAATTGNFVFMTTSLRVGRKSLLLAEPLEERFHLARQHLRMLERGEVPAFLLDRPAPDVGEHLFGERARRPKDLFWKFDITGRNIDRAAFRDGPLLRVQARVVRPERRADRAREPVERHVGEQLVALDRLVRLAARVRPPRKLFADPPRETGGRIGQSVRQRLRLRSLDVQIAALLFQPMIELLRPVLLVLRDRIPEFSP